MTSYLCRFGLTYPLTIGWVLLVGYVILAARW